MSAQNNRQRPQNSPQGETSLNEQPGKSWGTWSRPELSARPGVPHVRLCVRSLSSVLGSYLSAVGEEITESVRLASQDPRA